MLATRQQGRERLHAQELASCRHEVDELLDPARAGRARGRRRSCTRAEDVLPGAGDVGLGRGAASRGAGRRPSSTRPTRGTSGQAASPSRSGLTACQTSMNGWPTTSTCLPRGERATPWAIRLSLEPGHEVVDQDADPAVRAGPEVAQVVGEVVDAAEVLDDHALDPQVVAPDLLDELGVVAALDEDPAGPGDPGLARRGRRPSRTPCGSAWRARPARTGAREDHRPALEQEAGAERERTPPAAPVLERQRVEVAVDRDDLAAPVGGDLLDHRAELGDAPRRRGRAWARASRWPGRRCRSGLAMPITLGAATDTGRAAHAGGSVLGVVLVVVVARVGSSAVLPSSSSSPGVEVARGLGVVEPLGQRVVLAGLQVLGQLVVARCRGRRSRRWSSLMPEHGTRAQTSGSRFWLRGRCS